MGILSHDEILEVREAVVSARLAGGRMALLAGIDANFVAGLPQTAVPGEQLLTDLDALNAAGSLADDTNPLVRWLRNAIALAEPRKESEVFRRALTQLDGVGQAPKPPSTAKTQQVGVNAAVASFLVLAALGVRYARVLSYNSEPEVPLLAMKLDHAKLMPPFSPPTSNDCAEHVRGNVALDYRGTLRHTRTKKPLQNFAVVLLGTSCESVTDNWGVFSFASCDPKFIGRLRSHRISVTPQEHRGVPALANYCYGIALLDPPAVNDILFDPILCEHRIDARNPYSSDE